MEPHDDPTSLNVARYEYYVALVAGLGPDEPPPLLPGWQWRRRFDGARQAERRVNAQATAILRTPEQVAHDLVRMEEWTLERPISWGHVPAWSREKRLARLLANPDDPGTPEALALLLAEQEEAEMPIDYRKYPPEWKAIRQRILERAGHRCERCGLPNHALGYRDRHGTFWTEAEIGETFDGDPLQPLRPVRIVLTIAHIHDPDPRNCAEGNLQALCQQCHNRLDAPMRAKNAAKTRRTRGGQQELPL